MRPLTNSFTSTGSVAPRPDAQRRVSATNFRSVGRAAADAVTALCRKLLQGLQASDAAPTAEQPSHEAPGLVYRLPTKASHGHVVLAGGALLAKESTLQTPLYTSTTFIDGTVDEVSRPYLRQMPFICDSLPAVTALQQQVAEDRTLQFPTMPKKKKRVDEDDAGSVAAPEAVSAVPSHVPARNATPVWAMSMCFATIRNLVKAAKGPTRTHIVTNYEAAGVVQLAVDVLGHGREWFEQQMGNASMASMPPSAPQYCSSDSSQRHHSETNPLLLIPEGEEVPHYLSLSLPAIPASFHPNAPTTLPLQLVEDAVFTLEYMSRISAVRELMVQHKLLPILVPIVRTQLYRESTTVGEDERGTASAPSSHTPTKPRRLRTTTEHELPAVSPAASAKHYCDSVLARAGLHAVTRIFVADALRNADSFKGLVETEKKRENERQIYSAMFSSEQVEGSASTSSEVGRLLSQRKQLMSHSVPALVLQHSSIDELEAVRHRMERIQQRTATCLASLSCDNRNQKAILNMGVLPALLDLMNFASGGTSLQLGVVVALKELACHGSIAKRLAELGGIERVLGLLSTESEPLHNEVIAVLTVLSLHRGLEKNLMDAGVVEALLVHAQVRTSYPSIQALALQTVHNIVAQTRLRRAFMTKAGQQLLFGLKNLCLSRDRMLQKVVATILYRLSKTEEAQEAMVGSATVSSVVAALFQMFAKKPPGGLETPDFTGLGAASVAMHDDIERRAMSSLLSLGFVNTLQAIEDEENESQAAVAQSAAKGGLDGSNRRKPLDERSQVELGLLGGLVDFSDSSDESRTIGVLFAGVIAAVSQQSRHADRLIKAGAAQALVQLIRGTLNQRNSYDRRRDSKASSFSNGSSFSARSTGSMRSYGGRSTGSMRSMGDSASSFSSRGSAMSFQNYKDLLALGERCAYGLYHTTLTTDPALKRQVVEGKSCRKMHVSSSPWVNGCSFPRGSAGNVFSVAAV